MDKVFGILAYLPPDFLAWLILCAVSGVAGRYINPRLQTLQDWKAKPENQATLAVLGAAYRILDPVLQQVVKEYGSKTTYRVIEQVIRDCADGRLTESEIAQAMKMFVPVYDPIVGANAPMNDQAETLLRSLKEQRT